jgi:hypothetical protein
MKMFKVKQRIKKHDEHNVHTRHPIFSDWAQYNLVMAVAQTSTTT